MACSIPEVDFVAMKSGNFAPAAALALPLFGFTAVGADGSVSPAASDSTLAPNRGNRKESEECLPIIAASLVFRSGEAVRIGETSSENVRGDDRQAHVFARMERESLFRAVKATGEVLKAWLGRHQRLFNPLRSLSCSAASRSVSSTVRGDLLLSSQGEDASLGTLVMSSLRGVLDAQVMRKEKLLKQCLPTVARSVNADWCVVLEVVYTSDTPRSACMRSLFWCSRAVYELNGVSNKLQ